jgi:hypothetical protein
MEEDYRMRISEGSSLDYEIENLYFLLYRSSNYYFVKPFPRQDQKTVCLQEPIAIYLTGKNVFKSCLTSGANNNTR